MAEKKRFVYFGKNQRPTNISYNGISFPIAVGDVIECYPELIEHRMTEYREVKPGSAAAAKKPRHSFSRPGAFLRKDPTGGLPMRSSTQVAKKKDAPPPPPFLLIDKEKVDNPYDLGLDKEPTTELSTFKNMSMPEEKVGIDVPLVSMEEDTEDTLTEEQAAITEQTNISFEAPARSVLRKMSRSDIYNQVQQVISTGCELNPDMKDVFAAFEEDSTRGPMFKALWKYFGYDGE